MFWFGLVPVLQKRNKGEVEMIKCFNLALYQSHESRMKKWFTEDSVMPSVFLDSLLRSTISHIL